MKYELNFTIVLNYNVHLIINWYIIINKYILYEAYGTHYVNFDLRFNIQ